MAELGIIFLQDERVEREGVGRYAFARADARKNAVELIDEIGAEEGPDFVPAEVVQADFHDQQRIVDEIEKTGVAILERGLKINAQVGIVDHVADRNVAVGDGEDIAAASEIGVDFLRAVQDGLTKLGFVLVADLDGCAEGREDRVQPRGAVGHEGGRGEPGAVMIGQEVADRSQRMSHEWGVKHPDQNDGSERDPFFEVPLSLAGPDIFLSFLVDALGAYALMGRLNLVAAAAPGQVVEESGEHVFDRVKQAR